jgi:hypothetical protein
MIFVAVMAASPARSRNLLRLCGAGTLLFAKGPQKEAPEILDELGGIIDGSTSESELRELIDA